MKFGNCLPLCVVSATQLLVLLCSILTLYCPTAAHGLSFAEDVQSFDDAMLVQPSVSSLPRTALKRRVMLRHRCDPRTERELRKKLIKKERMIRKLRLRLAWKANKTKLGGKYAKVEEHHESPYCLPYGSIEENLERFNSNSELTAVREKVNHLRREVKSLQRWFMKHLPATYDRRELAVSEEKRIREYLLPNWNASEFAFSSDSQSLSVIMDSFRDGLIIIGSVVHRMPQTEGLTKRVADKLKHLQRSRNDHHFGIYPLFEDLLGLAASRNATRPKSRLCTGTELRDKVAALEAGSKDSLCRTGDNIFRRYCRSYGFFTFVRRFMLHLEQTVAHLLSSADSALI